MGRCPHFRGERYFAIPLAAGLRSDGEHMSGEPSNVCWVIFLNEWWLTELFWGEDSISAACF